MKKNLARVLVLDDDNFVRMTLGEALRSWKYETVEAATVADASKVILEEDIAAALLDIDLPDGSGLDVLDALKEASPETIAIMITGDVSVSNTIAALRGGAHDFVGKPIRLEELKVTLENGLETRELRRRVKLEQRRAGSAFGFEEIVGDSPTMQKTKELARRIAESDVPSILLQGETGTGKDLFARAIHTASERANGPYVAINCAALPATLIESELFGHEKGAFTDAKARKEGLLEQAQGGTIFLDEIGEMELPLQAKLLRVLESGVFRRVGGLKDIPLDVRIVAASNQDLKRAGEEGTFRLDLYFRLSVMQIDIPPLRERGGDVLLLAETFIERANERRRGPKLKGLSRPVAAAFRSYNWIGNVRELRNVIERAAVLEDGQEITTEFLPPDIIAADGSGAASAAGGIRLPADGVTLETLEAELAKQAVERTHGNLTQAAKLLGISRDQLRYKLKKFGLYEDVSA